MHHHRFPKLVWLSLLAGIVFSLWFTTRVASAQTCVNDVSGITNNCTAHDVNVLGVELVSGSDTVCTGVGDNINVTLRVRLSSNATTRYDIGVFTALDGGDALTGQCSRSLLSAQSATPFIDADSDACGDITSDLEVSQIIGPITIVCQDNDGDGFVDVSSVVTWDNNHDNVCMNVNDIAPDSRSKCSANADIKLPIRVQAPDVHLTKFADAPMVNAGDQVGFTLEVSNTVPGTVADAVRVTDTLAAGLVWTIANGSDPGCTIGTVSGTPNVLTCNFGSINGSTDTVRRVRVFAETTIANCGFIANVAEATYQFSGVTERAFAWALTAVDCSRLTVDKVTLPSGNSTPFTFTLSTNGTVITTFTMTDGQEIAMIAPLTPTLTYNLDEEPVPGWQQTDANCEESASAAVVRLRSRFGGLGITKNCVFTNTQLATLQVIKSVTGGDGTFGYTLTNQPTRIVTATTGTPGNAEWLDLPPGQPYTLAEALNPLWQAGTFSCVSTTASGSTNFTGPASGVTFTPQPGASIACAISNVRRGTIRVTKQNLGDPTHSFTFQSNFGAEFELSDGLTYTSAPLDPGTYSVAEEAVAGWLQTSATCDDGSSPDNITLNPGEVVTCTFVNTELSSVQVTKLATSTTGASDVFTFTTSLTSTGEFTLSAGTTPGQITFGDLLPSTYTLAEVGTPGWTLLAAVCRDASTGEFAPELPQLQVGAGQQWNCVYLNRLIQPAITLEKQVTAITDPTCAEADESAAVLSGGSVIYCFEIINTGNVTVTSPMVLNDPLLALNNQALPFAEIGLGASVLYTVSATANTLTNTATVSVTSPNGVLTATDEARVVIADLQLNKRIGVAGGPFVDTTPATPFLADVGQLLQWHWTITNSGDLEAILILTDTLDGAPYPLDCPVPPSLESGASFSCTSDPFPAQLGAHINAVTVEGCFVDTTLCDTHSDEEAYVTRPQLTVTKIVQNHWNGPRQAGDFALFVTGDGQTIAVTSGVTENLDAGVYQVSEQTVAGYSFTGFSGDCTSTGTITLANGNAYQCTLTNEDMPAQLNLVKIVESAPPFTQTFDLTIDGQVVGTVTGPQERLPAQELAAGSYIVGEVTPPADYSLAIGGDCAADGSIDVTNGMTYTCIITNTRAGRIQVIKEVSPLNATTQFTFIPSFAAPFQLGGGDLFLSDLLPAGTYSVVENSQPGWQQIGSLCSNGQSANAINLGHGETITCIFENRQLARILVDKKTDPTSATTAFEFGTNFAPNFTLRDGERFTSDYLLPSSSGGPYSVTEFEPQGWRATSATCNNGDAPNQITLLDGEEVLCTFQNTQEAAVGDRVWEDVISDGSQDDPVLEPGTPGIIVTLLDTNGNALAFKVTNNDGLYRFDFVSAGPYVLEFREPAGRATWAVPNVGQDDTHDSDAIPDPTDDSTARTTQFTLAPGTFDDTRDAGLVDIEIANTAAISGLAWQDNNQNGIREAGEPLLGGITVELYVMQAGQQSVVQGILLDTGTTGADGSFLFSDLNPNRYALHFVAGNQFLSTIESAGNDSTVDSDINDSGETDIFFVAPASVDTRRDAGFVAIPTNLEPGEQPHDSSRLWLPSLDAGE